MNKDISNLCLNNFKPVIPLLLLNITGYALLYWFFISGEPYYDPFEKPDYHGIYLLVGWLFLWMIISFLLRKGTTFLQFIGLWALSTFSLILILVISPASSGDNILGHIIGFPTTLCCIITGITLLLRKHKKVGSSPAFLFALATWSMVLLFLMFFLMLLMADIS